MEPQGKVPWRADPVSTDDVTQRTHESSDPASAEIDERACRTAIGHVGYALGTLLREQLSQQLRRGAGG